MSIYYYNWKILTFNDSTVEWRGRTNAALGSVKTAMWIRSINLRPLEY